MRIVLKCLDFLVASNFYVALGVYTLTWLSLEMRASESSDLAMFVGFSTLFAYNFMRLIRMETMLFEGESRRHQTIFKYRKLLWLICLASAFIALYFFRNLYQHIFLMLVLMAIISLTYALPIYKQNNKWFRLRDIPTIKIFLIAFVWSMVTEGFPALVSGEGIRILPLCERFLFVFAITIPFDIRDIQFDKQGLATLPQVFGINRARWIGVAAVVAAEIILAYRFVFLQEINLQGAIAMYLVYEIAALLIYKSHPQLNERYFTLGVEGLSILLGVFFMLSQMI